VEKEWLCDCVAFCTFGEDRGWLYGRDAHLGQLDDLVASFLDHDAEPLAHVGGDHVGQAHAGGRALPPDLRRLTHKNEQPTKGKLHKI